MLPDRRLAPAYGDAVWFWLYRDFSKSPADRAAENVMIRLGLTMYPQLYLVHPRTLERLRSTGRRVEAILAAIRATSVPASRTTGFADEIVAATKRADDLLRSGSARRARKALEDEDLLVRYRAVEILAEKAPAEVAKRAGELLGVPNDPLRFAVCEALRRAADPAAARALEAVVREPKDALNPNVLRSRAVSALGACGDADSVAAIGPFAGSGDYRNGLTRVSIAALVAIAERVRDARHAAVAALVGGYPKPAADARLRRACESLAKTVHEALGKLTGKRVPFPKTYDAAARERLAKAW